MGAPPPPRGRRRQDVGITELADLANLCVYGVPADIHDSDGQEVVPEAMLSKWTLDIFQTIGGNWKSLLARKSAYSSRLRRDL